MTVAMATRPGRPPDGTHSPYSYYINKMVNDVCADRRTVRQRRRRRRRRRPIDRANEGATQIGQAEEHFMS